MFSTCNETDQTRNPAASIWIKTNEEIRVLPVKTLQSQDVFLFRYQKVDQHCARKKRYQKQQETHLHEKLLKKHLLNLFELSVTIT